MFITIKILSETRFTYKIHKIHKIIIQRNRSLKLRTGWEGSAFVNMGSFNSYISKLLMFTVTGVYSYEDEEDIYEWVEYGCYSCYKFDMQNT